jgi:methionyl-tRNA formyltransferase
MQMETGLDTGPIWAQAVVPIDMHDNFGSLSGRLLRESVALLVDLLSDPPFASRAPQPQSQEGVVYAHKIRSEDQEVVFSAPARAVFGQIRALDPSPAARTSLHGRPLKCGGVSLAIESGQWGTPGEVLALPTSNHGLKIACGHGVIVLHWLQQAGGKRLAVQDFCRGHRVCVGDRLGH